MGSTFRIVKYAAALVSAVLILSACSGLGEDSSAIPSPDGPLNPAASPESPTTSPPTTGADASPSGNTARQGFDPQRSDPPSPLQTTPPGEIADSGPFAIGFAAAPPSVEIKKPRDGRRFTGEVGAGGGLGAFVDLNAKTGDPVTGALEVRWEVDGAVVAIGDNANDVWIPRSPNEQLVTIVAIGSSNGIDAAIDQVTIEVTPSLEITKPKDGAVVSGEDDGAGNVGAFVDLDAATDALRGDTMNVRWEVGGNVVATGDRPNGVWIPRGASDPVLITAIGTVDGVDVAIDQVALRIGPALTIKKPAPGATFKGEFDPTLGAYVDLDADVESLDGSTIDVRWEVGGSVVATGERVKDAWIPRGPDDQAVEIVAIGSVNGTDVTRASVTISITPSIEIRDPDDGTVFEGTFDPATGRGAFVDLRAKTTPLRGDTMTVRWEVDGVEVATGDRPGETWIPSTTDVDAIVIVAIGSVDGSDVARDTVTIVIFAPSPV